MIKDTKVKVSLNMMYLNMNNVQIYVFTIIICFLFSIYNDEYTIFFRQELLGHTSILYINLLYKMGHYFLDIQYIVHWTYIVRLLI